MPRGSDSKSKPDKDSSHLFKFGPLKAEARHSRFSDKDAALSASGIGLAITFAGKRLVNINRDRISHEQKIGAGAEQQHEQGTSKQAQIKIFGTPIYTGWKAGGTANVKVDTKEGYYQASGSSIGVDAKGAVKVVNDSEMSKIDVTSTDAQANTIRRQQESRSNAKGGLLAGFGGTGKRTTEKRDDTTTNQDGMKIAQSSETKSATDITVGVGSLPKVIPVRTEASVSIKKREKEGTEFNPNDKSTRVYTEKDSDIKVKASAAKYAALEGELQAGPSIQKRTSTITFADDTIEKTESRRIAFGTGVRIPGLEIKPEAGITKAKIITRDADGEKTGVTRGVTIDGNLKGDVPVFNLGAGGSAHIEHSSAPSSAQSSSLKGGISGVLSAQKGESLPNRKVMGKGTLREKRGAGERESETDSALARASAIASQEAQETERSSSSDEFGFDSSRDTILIGESDNSFDSQEPAFAHQESIEEVSNSGSDPLFSTIDSDTGQDLGYEQVLGSDSVDANSVEQDVPNPFMHTELPIEEFENQEPHDFLNNLEQTSDARAHDQTKESIMGMLRRGLDSLDKQQQQPEEESINDKKQRPS